MINEKLQVKIGPVVCAYPQLDKPRIDEDGNDKGYGLLLLVPKKDLVTLEKIKSLVNPLIQTAFGGQKPANLPIKDGDEKVDTWGEAFSGMWYVRVGTRRAPKLYDNRVRPADPGIFYSGCKVCAVVSAYAYNKVQKGINLSLDLLQFWADGTPIGAAEADPDEWLEAAPNAEPEQSGSDSLF